MVEGAGSDDYRHVKSLMYSRPDLMHRILEVNAQAVAAYLNAQIDAGAQAVMIFDSWGGVLADVAFQQFSLKYTAQVLSKLKRSASGQTIPRLVFTKGGGLWLSEMYVHERVIVIDVSQERNDPLVLVNPKLVWTSPETHLNEEGCLSVPGIYDGVTRHNAVHVHALDDKGQGRVIEAQELLAVCIQHEMDHLMGKVFVEYLSPLKRNRIKTKMLKAQREDAR
jgi:peptide deformylase